MSHIQLKKGAIMSFWIGTAIKIIGFLGALYVSIYVMFVGGIVDIIDVFKAESIDSVVLAWGIAKVVLASFVGWIIFRVCMLISEIIDD